MGARFGIERSDHVEYGFWLTFGVWNNAPPSVRCTASEPKLERGERSMFVSCKLPLSLFSIPTLRATINVADGAPKALNVDVTAMQEAIRAATGMDMTITVEGAS